MESPRKIVSTYETKQMRETFNLYLDEKVRLLRQLDDCEKAFAHFSNDRQRLIRIQLLKNRIDDFTTLMRDLDDQINIKLGIYGKDC